MDVCHLHAVTGEDWRGQIHQESSNDICSLTCRSAAQLRPLSFLLAQHMRPHTLGHVSGVNLAYRVIWWINVLSYEGG